MFWFFLFRMANIIDGKIPSHVLWGFPSSCVRKPFLISWFRRSTGFARGWYIGVVHASVPHLVSVSFISLDTNCGPLSDSITRGYPKREQNSFSIVSTIILVVAVPIG